MKIISYNSVANFQFWSGAKVNAESLTLEQLDTLDSILEDIFPDGMTETELNDLLWFDFDAVKEWLGIESDDEE